MQARAWGTEDADPIIPDGEFGGWVYERAYLGFRFAPPTSMSGEHLDDYFEETMGPLEEALAELLQPSRADHICFHYAMDLFTYYHRWGLPNGEGYANEPSLTQYILECVIIAHERSERETRAADERMRAEDARAQANKGEQITSDVG